jgi:hypothetical protein
MMHINSKAADEDDDDDEFEIIVSIFILENCFLSSNMKALDDLTTNNFW